MQPEVRDELLNDVSSHLYVARTSIYIVQTFLGDAFIVRTRKLIIEICFFSSNSLVTPLLGLSLVHRHREEQVYATILNCLHFRLDLWAFRVILIYSVSYNPPNR